MKVPFWQWSLFVCGSFLHWQIFCVPLLNIMLNHIKY